MRRWGSWLAPWVLALLTCAADGSRVVLFEKQSPYARVSVQEDGAGLRYLQFDDSGALQSVVKPGAPRRLELAYTRVAMVGLAFVPQPRRILVVGLGGGAMPMFLRAVLPRARIDVVDIDPVVVDVARRYFGFHEDSRLVAHVADGRAFIEAQRPAYDLVFLDAYGPDSIPEHLATVEFLAAVRARLTGRGAAVGNVWADPPNSRYGSMARTWQAAFTQLYTFEVEGSANRILVGVPSAEKQSRKALEARARAKEGERGVPFALSELVARGYEDATAREQPPGVVLRDALVPASAPPP
ncbi:fused MFS/spermidine synthase [Myxococcus sp. K15C18031901]|uniref:spermidine synthase n=1 Tax=Myxococcus dinghuensis TaxID=2906761 RepID=UPI0020A78C35|nr:fused MFS/spermidine synthase [Myxococcus dinghuensis]MCP3098865.1 fused MFS/spermidine synthase [Myxococcus dinghuensis]